MKITEWIEFSEKNIMTKREVQKYLNMSERGINQSLYTGRLKPLFERGEGRSKVRLFYRPDVEEYRKSVERQHRRLNIEKD